MEFSPGFILDESGYYFTVLIFNDYVVKIPKKDLVKDVEELKFIADTQTELAEHVNGVLPCWLIENVLVMPKAKGRRADACLSKKAHIKGLKMEILSKIKDMGYELKDTGSRNMFYDEAEDQVYMIDFHAVKVLDERKRTKHKVEKEGRLKNR